MVARKKVSSKINGSRNAGNGLANNNHKYSGDTALAEIGVARRGQKFVSSDGFTEVVFDGSEDRKRVSIEERRKTMGRLNRMLNRAGTPEEEDRILDQLLL